MFFILEIGYIESWVSTIGPIQTPMYHTYMTVDSERVKNVLKYIFWVIISHKRQCRAYKNSGLAYSHLTSSLSCHGERLISEHNGIGLNTLPSHSALILPQLYRPGWSLTSATTGLELFSFPLIFSFSGCLKLLNIPPTIGSISF